ncbi:NTP transferase domain-containing protein [Actinomadura harenae]|uniref:Molybdenum cofactor guanylyltransferase n=1 Tax=Actinomadura harenae TaxID=2483351 RepID=A0A3M2LJ48_9ACTN|nr:NTP transferase domain-containing protein [Actinomadura harenae]RMI36035.1 molybdenum cofactor guanylyltransferase [Actinomadura harenae]
MASDGAADGFDAVLLAGGLARRMGGVDKPALEVGGTPLLVLTARAVEAAGRVVVAGPPHPGLPDATYVREDPPGSGPVPALRAGFAEVRAPWTVLLAADLPFLRPEHVDVLLGAARRADADGAVFVDDEGRLQWLTGVWRTESLRRALDGYGGQRLRGVLRGLRPLAVAVRAGAGERPPWFDCDTPEALAEAGSVASGPYDRSRDQVKGEMTVLEEWIEAVCLELGVERAELDRDLVLDLARDVAHGVARPAAPLTAYLLGLAIGRGTPPKDAATRVSEMALAWKGDADG